MGKLKPLIILSGLGWPLLVWWLHDDVGSWPLLMGGVLLLAWRLPDARRLGVYAAIALLLTGLLVGAELGMRAYPIAINAVMLTLFATSLWRGQPIIERLARRHEPALSPTGVRYTRRVTQAWCGFFFVNGAIAAWTALYADLSVWTLYNGGISYGLIALMFLGEWLCRRRLRKEPTSCTSP
jgi:uncharacterized membrane protein